MESLTRFNSFPITVYGDLESFNKVTSKARCRIFYKGCNRNGTYISDEFADKLLATIPYTPVKGIYDGEDYTDHGHSRSLGRIYGIVPENPNLCWEKHMDEDGIEREYACVDVLIFTALYGEAAEAIGRAQSMELYDESIEGQWTVIDGTRYYEFTNACFLGLQILGEEVEPCFEGAGFFSLCDSVNDMIKKIEEYNLKLENINKGGTSMSVINYRLSDGEKFQALWSLLNENYTEEGNWAVDYDICEVYDDYALCKNYAENCFERVYYEKNDEDNSVHVCGKKKCCILDVTEEEYAALNAIRMINESSFEKIDEKFTNLQTENQNLVNQNSEFELKITELSESVSTLETERDEIRTQYENANNLLNESKETLESAQASLATLQSECDSLKEYKLAIEKAEKESVIASYTELLNDEVIAKYTEKIAEYTALELDKELAYELKNSNPAVFTKTTTTTVIPKDVAPKSSLEEILSRYQK